MSLKKSITGFIYHKLFGWKSSTLAPDLPKYVICCAPHTSNWDFIMGKLFYVSIGRETMFMMKKDWFVFPFKSLLTYMGGIPVNRSKSVSLVDQMAKKCDQSEQFHLAITPEGTRSLNTNWKKGFYYIALKANIPILIVSIDYKKKLISADHYFTPTGDEKSDLKEIKRFFKVCNPKHPEKFGLGDID